MRPFLKGVIFALLLITATHASAQTFVGSVSGTVKDQQGAAVPGANNNSVYGGESSSANALLIDGVDTRDPEGGTAWTFYNYNMVEEVQIQGLGAPAEYGGFTGAVVNTVTKSGGNRFSGLFDIIGSNSSLAGNNITTSIATQNPALAKPAVVKKFVDFTT